jgi:ketosteroid isomerase-like protein
MSEQSNSQLVLSLYEAFRRGDYQFILDRCTDDVEWITEGPSTIPYVGRFLGKAEVASFFQALESTQTDKSLITDKLIAQGNLVAVVGRYAATVKATGVRADSALAQIFTIRDGKVSQFLDFFDTAAMSAAYTASAAGV